METMTSLTCSTGTKPELCNVRKVAGCRASLPIKVAFEPPLNTDKQICGRLAAGLATALVWCTAVLATPGTWKGTARVIDGDTLQVSWHSVPYASLTG